VINIKPHFLEVQDAPLEMVIQAEIDLVKPAVFELIQEFQGLRTKN
jgi:hypothetical protein